MPAGGGDAASSRRRPHTGLARVSTPLGPAQATRLPPPLPQGRRETSDRRAHHLADRSRGRWASGAESWASTPSQYFASTLWIARVEVAPSRSSSDRPTPSAARPCARRTGCGSKRLGPTRRALDLGTDRQLLSGGRHHARLLSASVERPLTTACPQRWPSPVVRHQVRRQIGADDAAALLAINCHWGLLRFCAAFPVAASP